MNRATLELEFFPVSIFGIAAGRGYHQRPKFSSQFDCDKESCNGVLVRDTIRAQLLLGYQGFFSALVLRKEWIQSSLSDVLFTEEGAGVLGRGGGDQLMTKTWALGYSKDRWTYALNLIHTEFIQNRNFALTSVLIVNRAHETFSWTFGAGTFASSHMERGLTFVGMLNYNVKRMIGLF
jgi:hypothetical protein